MASTCKGRGMLQIDDGTGCHDRTYRSTSVGAGRRDRTAVVLTARYWSSAEVGLSAPLPCVVSPSL